jgi:hypothetical protein
MPPGGVHRLAWSVVAIDNGVCWLATCVPRSARKENEERLTSCASRCLNQLRRSSLSKAVGTAWEYAVALDAAKCVGGHSVCGCRAGQSQGGVRFARCVRAAAPCGGGSAAARPASQAILHFYVARTPPLANKADPAPAPPAIHQSISVIQPFITGHLDVLTSRGHA